MRTSLAVFGGLAMLFVGFFAIWTQAENVRSTAMNSTANRSSEAYEAAKGVFEGVGNVAGPTLVIAGVAAFMLIAAAVLVATYAGGR